MSETLAGLRVEFLVTFLPHNPRTVTYIKPLVNSLDILPGDLKEPSTHFLITTTTTTSILFTHKCTIIN